MAAWDLLAEGRRPRKYRAGQLVYLQGARPDRFYYLISGMARSFISTGDGEERVLAAFQRHPELALPMLQYLARTVRMLSGHVESSALPARQRVARWLLAQPGRTLKTTHEGIGQAVGLSRVTVSRVLGELAALGLVKLGYRSVAVLDRAGLEALAFPAEA